MVCLLHEVDLLTQKNRLRGPKINLKKKTAWLCCDWKIKLTVINKVILDKVAQCTNVCVPVKGGCGEVIKGEGGRYSQTYIRAHHNKDVRASNVISHTAAR